MIVVISADQQLGAGVAFVQFDGDWDKVAGIERDGNWQPGGLVQTSGSGVAFCHQANPVRAADLEPVAFFGEAGGPEILVAAFFGLVGVDDLQAMDGATGVEQRQGHVAGGGEADAVGGNALLAQIGTVAFVTEPVPHAGGFAGGAFVARFLFGIGAALVLGHACLERSLLLWREAFGFGERDLLRVVFVAAPLAKAADQQDRAIITHQLMQAIPSALFLAVVFDVAAVHAARVERRNNQSCRLHLGEDVVVIRGDGDHSFSPARVGGHDGFRLGGTCPPPTGLSMRADTFMATKTPRAKPNASAAI